MEWKLKNDGFNLLRNGHIWHFGFCFNKHIYIYKEVGQMDGS